ncbi:PhnB protein [Streptoalloteichus tenebrarius]|uniref:PhnB protein n=1 Tax=Streptoalloteichus tenebrarius (strain ATCC 17920 / DSM 40477 / JCM 4838 / CBS 697.72 / NBRC 16177 / NCIMB 11028 / NRRL B-12390 / A12253. 1 / ISP 5477) TaxID=1933 RepID=A0ABT1HPU0_STRSD|nr:VOC family protein [Streptoalloteichus tenebrarius]MCP2257503.1 PhnB protein [Streptoalloteichus tenebrarius]BFE98453.1 VOC family protein [Streptoalloteichus tenebrarius]
MVAHLNPYIILPGTARQAGEFYRSVFGGELVLRTYADIGDPNVPHPDRIMHGVLVTDQGHTLMVADAPPGADHTRGDTISLTLNGDDAELLRGYWEKLSSTGTVVTPLEKQMWGDEFGMCVDQFGVSWMVNISRPQT